MADFKQLYIDESKATQQTIEQVGSDAVVATGAIKSKNYAKGKSGYILDDLGNVEFNTGTFRGALAADSIDIPDTTTANSFHVDADGNMWLGATSYGSAPAKISNAGAATFNTITINDGANVSIQAPLELAFTCGEDLTAGNAVFIEDSASTLAFTYKTITANSNSVDFGLSTGAQKLAQSFTSTVGFTVNEVKARLFKVGSPGDSVQISVQADSSGAPSGTPLASGTISSGTISGVSITQYTVTFSGNSGKLDANTTYWIVLERTGALSDSAYYTTADAVDTYADGAQFFYNGSVWANVTITGSNTDMDLVINGTGVPGFLYKTDADNAGQYENFIGFVKANVTQGDQTNIIVNGQYSGLSGLSIGSTYYISNTRGEVSSSAGTNSRKVGIATSATSIFIINSI